MDMRLDVGRALQKYAITADRSGSSWLWGDGSHGGAMRTELAGGHSQAYITLKHTHHHALARLSR